MELQRRIDPAGILQLVGAAAAFAAIAVSAASLSAHGDLSMMIVIGVAAAAAGVLVQFWQWERLGGRRVVVATNSWIRTRRIPSSVPREIWVPRLKQAEARALQRRGYLVLVAIELPLSATGLITSESAIDQVLWICALAFWTGVAVWTLYYNLRVLPVIRRLLRQPSTLEALPVSGGQG